MKKFLFSLPILALLFLAQTKEVKAQCALNLADVNAQNFQACAGNSQGGTVYILYQPTSDSAEKLQSIVNLNNQLVDQGQGVNLAVRLYVPGRPPSQAEVASTIATVGSSGSSTKITLMLWNEPNNYWRESQGISDAGVLANAIVQNQDFARDAINTAGLSGLIELGTPMFDFWASDNPTTGQVSMATLLPLLNQEAQRLGYNGFFDQRLNDILLVNYYTKPNDPTILGGINYRNLFNSLGIPYNMPWAAAESGLLLDKPTYDAAQLLPLYQRLSQIWKNDPTFKWFSIFARNPDSTDSYNLLGSPELLAFLQSMDFQGVNGASINQANFNTWLASVLNSLLVRCTKGFSPDATYCLAARGTQVLNLCRGGTGEKTNEPRPFECQTCYTQIPNPSSSCATSFAARDQVSYAIGSGEVCGGNAYTKIDWSGSVTVDPTGAQMPFVGKNSQRTQDPDTREAQNEERMKSFLGEYFGGTLYGPYYFYNRDNASEEGKRVVNEAGVFRKLAPLTMQDNLKKQIIQRAVDSRSGGTSNPVQNYTVSLERKFMSSGFLDFFAKRFPIIRNIIDDDKKILDFADKGRQPPSLNTPNYREEYRKWLCSDGFCPFGIVLVRGPWASLWKAIPMFSEEDTPGTIALSPQSPNSSLQVSNPESLELQVPHVQRLAEITDNIQKILFPKKSTGGRFSDSGGIEEEKGGIVIAGAETSKNLLAANVLQAQSGCPYPLKATIENVRLENGVWQYGVRISQTNPASTGAIGDVLTNPQIGIHYENIPAPPRSTYLDTSYPGASQFLPTYPSTADPSTIRVVVHDTTRPQCPDIIAGGAGPSGPVCGQPDLGPVNTCTTPGDPGSGGDLLCSGGKPGCIPVNATLRVREVVGNPPRTPQEIQDRITSRSKDVERGISISLTMPQLDNIWEKSIKGTDAIFKIFKSNKEYDSIVASDVPGESNPISYTYRPSRCVNLGIFGSFCVPGGGNTATPTNGTIKYSHLGAIFRVKELVLKTLNPWQIFTGTVSAGYTTADIDTAIAQAATKYSVPAELLRAVYEIEGVDFIASPQTWRCVPNSATALGLAQVIHPTYLNVTLPSERLNNDIEAYNKTPGKLSRCNTQDAFELMARVLLSKVGRLNYSTMTASAPINISEKDTIYRSTCRYYGSPTPDGATSNYSYNIDISKKRTDGSMNYCDIVCLKLGQCPPYPPQSDGR